MSLSRITISEKMPVTRSMSNKTNIIHIYDDNFNINNYRIKRQAFKYAQKEKTTIKNIFGFIVLALIAIHVGMVTYLTYKMLSEKTQEYIRSLFIWTYTFKDQINILFKMIITYIDFVPILLMLVLLFMI